MKANKQYELKIGTEYLRTEPSNYIDREKDPINGKCNNFNNRKNDGTPLYITEHHTSINFEKSLNIFLKGSVSTHYMIDKDGTVYNFVADKYRAYHAGAGELYHLGKLHKIVQKDLLKGTNEAGELGKGTGDINSWSIGIENVNNGFEPFTPEQTRANIYLHEMLIKNHNIQPENIISHAEWAIGRKFDPSPYYDWQALATASDKYKDIEHNFGFYPTISLKQNSAIILSPNSNQRDDVAHVQQQLAKLGYSVLNEDQSNLGEFDKKTRDTIFTFTIRYLNKSIIDNEDKLRLWNLIDSDRDLCLNQLGIWTENHENAIIDILRQYDKH